MELGLQKADYIYTVYKYIYIYIIKAWHIGSGLNEKASSVLGSGHNWTHSHKQQQEVAIRSCKKQALLSETA